MKTTERLTLRELNGYRQRLSDLDEEARDPGGGLTRHDPELRQYFDPDTLIGRQVYESYTDEELLDILIRTLQQQGYNPHFELVYCGYKDYMHLRFNQLNMAKDKARARLEKLCSLRYALELTGISFLKQTSLSKCGAFGIQSEKNRRRSKTPPIKNEESCNETLKSERR